MKQARGFTLLEVMVTVVIVAVLAAVAAPGIKAFMENNQIRAESQRLAGILTLARSQAVTDNVPVIVFGNVAAGALTLDVYTNGNEDATVTFEAGVDTYIERSPGNSTDLDIGSNAVVAGDNAILFDANGRMDEAGVAVVTFCNADNTQGRRVSVNLVGRVSVSDLNNPGAECL